MSHKHDLNCVEESGSGRIHCKITREGFMVGDDPRTPYYMSGRGESYRLTTEGYIKRLDMPFAPSPSWIVAAVVQHWKQQPYSGLTWNEIKRELDAGKTVTGYLYDRDHGTLRMWAGRYLGKIPKVTIRKIGG